MAKALGLLLAIAFLAGVWDARYGDEGRPGRSPAPFGTGQVELRAGGDQVHEAVGNDPAGTALALNGQLPEAAYPRGQRGRRCLLTIGDGGFGRP